MKEEIQVIMIDNQKISKNKQYLSHIKNIMISNNENFSPTLFERINHPGSLKEKVEFAIQNKLKDNYHYILAIKKNVVVGFTEFKEDETIHEGNIKKSLNVGMSAVHKDLHGKGVAKLLYTFLDELATVYNVDMISRKTWSTNLRQLMLYEKFGYIETERIKDFRGKGIDSISFCKLFKT